MSPRFRFFSVVLLLVSLATLASSQSTRKKTPRKARVKEPVAQVLPPLPTGPLPQLPLDSVPAVAPKVSYEAGNLTIEAHNSNLSDILKAVQERTGAAIDAPASANERVVTQLGPGPARDVLAKLLNGSHYNYVMLGSPSDPNAVSKVILTSRVTGGPDTPAPSQAANQQAFQPMNPTMPQGRPVMAPQPPQPQGEAEAEEEPEPEPDAQEGNDPAEQPVADDSGAQQNQNQQMPGQGPKTPEQLLQELQRQQQVLQQQQQQQQQQQNQSGGQPPNQNPPPPQPQPQ
jgi:hypothetical protein